MIVVGIAFLLWAALIQFIGVSMVTAALATGVVFVLLGLLFGERLPR
jgi:drug/metabolite transporter (DMT)-like permease